MVATLVVLTGSAIAYFSAGGGGTASAAVTKLTAPTISAATPNAGGTVTLSWSGVTAPGEGALSYYVTRDGEDVGGNCPTRSAPTTVKTCTDSSVPIGEHVYVVTAAWKTWTAASAAKTANVTVGAVSKFVIAASTTTPTAGGSTNLTITAKDVNSSTVTTYASSHTLVFSGASASPGGTAPTVVNSSGTSIAFGSSTALTFTAGVASVSSSKNGVLKLYRSGAANLVATEGAITTPAPLALTVSPAAASKYVVAAATLTPVAAADALTITAQDTYGNTATGYTGPHSLVYSGASVSPAGNTPTVTDSDGDEIAFGAATETEFNAGVASPVEGDNGAMRLYKSGAVSLKATEGSITNTALAITVSAGTAAKLAVAAATLTPVAAAADILTITAQDSYGNTATGYTGAKNLTFSGATASPSGAAPTVANSSGTAISFGSETVITFTSGVATATSTKNGTLKLNRVGAASLTATDGTISSAPALSFTVSAGAPSRWGLTNTVTSAGAIGSPCLFTCVVTLLGNSGTLKANVSVTDSVGNVVSELGTGHAAKVTATGTVGSTVVGTPLEIPATGPAISATQFTYAAPASGAFSNTLTVAVSTGTAYTTATASTSK